MIAYEWEKMVVRMGLEISPLIVKYGRWKTMAVSCPVHNLFSSSRWHYLA